MADVLLIEKTQLGSGHKIEIWTLNRPDKLNAINSEVIEALEREGNRLREDLQKDLLVCRAVILQSAGGKAFAAGADISEMEHFKKSEAAKFSTRAQQAFGRLEELQCPTIAAIDGFALGGGLELAMCCDILVAGAKAQFGQPEAALGLIPGFGATARFVERLGVGKALELLYTCARIKADEAYRLGLVQKLVPEGKTALDAARELVAEMTDRSSPLALAKIKDIVRRKTRSHWAETLKTEASQFGEIFESEDKRAGVAAFLTKGKAVFTGR